MHVYGLMPAPLAAAATLAFCAFLALYPALALGVSQRLAPAAWIRLPLLLPAAWTLSEWLRGTLFTGFPWLAAGYAHTDSVLAGFAPVAGVYGVTLAAALLAGALALIALPLRVRGRRGYAWIAGAFVLLIGGGAALKSQAWTQPAGTPISVRLVQANIPQDTKFGPEGLQRAFDAHWALMQGPRVDLVALPESVFPVPLQFVPPQYLEAFENHARSGNSALVFGVFLEQPAGAYYNSAVGIAPGDAPPARYSKRHLVPFGEFIPPGFRWFVDLMQMPIGDQQRGAAVQPPMELAGQRVAVNICYEDLFGEVIIDAWKRRRAAHHHAEHVQPRVVPGLAGAAATPADFADAGAGDTAPDAPRDQHRRDRDHRCQRPGHGRAAVPHRRRPDRAGAGDAGHDAVHPLGQRAGGGPGPADRAGGGALARRRYAPP